jgi:hypothetical protein
MWKELIFIDWEDEYVSKGKLINALEQNGQWQSSETCPLLQECL